MLSFPPYILDGSICADSDRPPKNLVPPMHLVSFPSLERPASPLFEADLQLVKRDKADHLVSDVVADGCMEINDQPAKGRGVTGLSDETSIALEPGTTLFSRSYVGVISSIGNETVLDPVPSLDDLVLWDVDVIVDASGSFPSVSFSESFHEERILVLMIRWGVSNDVQYEDRQFRINHHHLVALLKPRISGSRVDKVLSRFRFSNSFCVKSNDLSGGIWLLWNEEIDVEVLKFSNKFVHGQVHINDLRPGGEASWLLGGDFNSILRLEERDRGLVHGNGVNRPPQFEDFLWDNWDVSRDVEANIQVFADEVQQCNVSVFGNIGQKKKELLVQTRCIDKALHISHFDYMF
ncbi:hypothetical protein V6N13_074037 [Hibiscus sabdariffa]